MARENLESEGQKLRCKRRQENNAFQEIYWTKKMTEASYGWRQNDGEQRYMTRGNWEGKRLSGIAGVAQETGNKMVYARDAQDAQDAKNKVARIRR